MTFPTHLMAGLVIGKLTGNYALSITGALFLDLDHIFSYAKNGVLFKPKELWKALTDRDDPYGDQRYIFHNILFFLLFSSLVLIIEPKIALAFGLGYFSHIILDALDNSPYYPFFPNKKINIRGPIKYLSTGEGVIFCLLVIVFFLI